MEFLPCANIVSYFLLLITHYVTAINIIQVGSPLNGSCTLVQSLFSGASTQHGLSFSSAQFAILSSGFRAFVALTEVTQGDLQDKVFSP